MGEDRALRADATGTTEEVDIRETLAVRWADFTKSLSIYPETNTRVQQQVADLMAGLEEALGQAEAAEGSQHDEGVAILFRGENLVLDDEEREFPEGSNLAWLRSRLDRAALAGVEFLPRLEAADLITFTKHLLATYLRKDAALAFEALWPDPIPGMHLIDRRFEGTFGGRLQEQGQYRGGHASRGTLGAGEADLVKLLLEDDEIADRVANLKARVDEAEPEDGVRIQAADLLDRIVKNLPADAMKNRTTLIESMREVLSALQERVFQRQIVDGLSELQNDMTLSTLLYSVSRAHFARQAPDMTRWTLDELFPDVVQAKGKLGHVGDDKVQEDLDALLAELEMLPAELAADLSPGNAEVHSEELAVLLHYLVCAPDASEIVGLNPALNRLLTASGSAEEAVLREYLLKYGGAVEGGADESRVPPLLAFLQTMGHTSLLRSCGVFEVKWIVKVFPQFFTLYLKTLDARSAGDMLELDTICERLGHDALMEAEATILAGGAHLDLAQARLLLTQPSPKRLALTRHLLRLHGQAIVADVGLSLRRMEPAGAETFILYGLPDFKYLTVEYLICLIDLQLGRTVDQRRLRRAISEVLCRHVRGAREEDPKSRARLESIRNLIRYPSANGWHLLDELGRGGWLPFLAKEPAVVRRLARSIQQTHKAA